jgi:hypothetical protein
MHVPPMLAHGNLDCSALKASPIKQSVQHSNRDILSKQAFGRLVQVHLVLATGSPALSGYARGRSKGIKIKGRHPDTGGSAER